MRPLDALRAQISALDGQDYGAWQGLRGSYAAGPFQLLVDRVPHDPYAPPHTGVYRVRAPRALAGLSEATTPAGAVAVRDYVARAFHGACEKLCGGRRGTGYSGVITVAPPGQAILDRSSVALTAEHVEVRCFLGLPADGRAIVSRVALAMLFQELPAILDASLTARALDAAALARHVAAAEDAHHLRARLPELGLVAFLADGAVLPRASGVDPRPLPGAVRFVSPDSLRVVVDLPHAGPVAGMGVPQGVTLIVGGGYHGKSTLLHAIEQGVFDHVPGDGRERCATVPTAVKIRTAPGRNVQHTDVSAFITALPQGGDTSAFRTSNASGSTSQAASVAEAIEAGATALLLDEDTCAANLMSRDLRMQRLVARADEPITPLVERVRALWDRFGVSTVLVVGACGEWFDVADRVVQMVRFAPRDVSERAAAVARETPGARREVMAGPAAPQWRSPSPEGLDPWALTLPLPRPI